MSFDLQIWEQPNTLPTPDTVAQAGQISLTLQQRKAPINPKFVEFARQLVASYPSQKSDPANAVWVGDPVGEAQTCDDAVFSISLPPVNRLGLLRLVADTATALGLTVYDDQIGMAFLPTGVVLPNEHAEAWKREKQQMDVAPKPKTKAQMIKYLSEYWTPFFAIYGFKPVEKSAEGFKFERAIENGTQTIAAFVNGSGSEFACRIYLRVNNEVVTNLYKPYGNPNSVHEIVFPLSEWVPDRYAGYPTSSVEDIRWLTSQFETIAIPVLDSMRDIKGLNHIFNIDRPEALSREFLRSTYFMSFISLIVSIWMDIAV